MSTKYRDLLATFTETRQGAVAAFLEEKTASSLRDGAKNFGKSLGTATLNGVGSTLAAAAVTGVSIGAQKAYQALTRERDFRAMMEANQDLQEHHQADPKRFNLMFNSLRSMNPEFSADPIIAGSYLQKAMGNPGAAGTMLGEGLGLATRRNPNRFMDTIQQNAAGAFKMPQAPRGESGESGEQRPAPRQSFSSRTGRNVNRG